MATQAIEATVIGRVQGVGFRYTTQRTARALDIDGWVRNQPDGSVQVHAQGAAAAVEQLLDFLRQGPPGAVVRSVQSATVEVDPTLRGFTVRH